MRARNLSKKQIGIIFVAAVCIVACIIAIAVTPNFNKDKPSATESSVTSVITTENADTTENTTETEYTTVTEEFVPVVDPTGEYTIYDDQGITIKVGNMVHGENGLEFDCTAINSTGKELRFIVDIASVNGYMTGVYTSGTSFRTDGTIKVVLRVDNKVLERQFIKDIHTVEFRLYACDDDSNYYLLKEYSTVIFSHDTSSDDVEGRTVYDGSELKVTYLGLGNDVTGSLSTAFLLESKADRDMDIYLDMLNIDGKTVNMNQKTFGMSGAGVLLNPGKKSVFVPDAFTYLALKDKFDGFDATNTVEIAFVAKEWIDKTDIFTTDSILLAFPEDGLILYGSSDSETGVDDTPQGDGGFAYIKYGDGFFYAKDEIGDDGLRRIYYVPVIDGEIYYDEIVIHEYRDNGYYIISPVDSIFMEVSDYDSTDSWKYWPTGTGVEKFDIAKFEKYR